MNQSGISAPAAHRPDRRPTRQPAYGEQARSYDQKTGAFQSYRQAIIEALPVRRGQVVLDVGSGTGLCCGLLQDKVGPPGGVVGIEESPEAAPGCSAYAGRPGLAGVCSVLPGPGATDQQASSSARVNKCGALMQAPVTSVHVVD